MDYRDSPELWNYERSRCVDLLLLNPNDREKILVQPGDVVRYDAVCVRFRGHRE